MNKDEAERCIEIGLTALKSGDKDKAIRLFQKSLSLFPTEAAERYLKVAMTQPQTAKPQQQEPKPEPKKEEMKFTKEQESLCRQIIAKTDYYDILGISKTATQDEIKKSYRKMALKLHPDKNHAPSASEAFKKINKSFACLSDEVKKRTYDQTGQEEVHSVGMGNFREGDFAEHVFREFFGESFFASGPGFHTYTFNAGPRRHHQHTERAPVNGRAQFMQFLPILILIVLSLASNFQGSSEVYSFRYSSTYSVKRITENLNIEYYLTESYSKQLTHDERLTLENNVEYTYVNHIGQECEMLKRQKNSYMSKAKYYGGNTGKQYRDYADNLDMSSCKIYQDLKAKVY